MAKYSLDFEKILKSGGNDPKRIYKTVSDSVMETIKPEWKRLKKEKTACYLSAEFLIGRVVYSNLFNLGLLAETRDKLSSVKIDPNVFEQIEDCALGNGGLGRLAACFMDSAATHNIRLDGYGIRYRYGLFKQYFDKG